MNSSEILNSLSDKSKDNLVNLITSMMQSELMEVMVFTSGDHEFTIMRIK